MKKEPSVTHNGVERLPLAPRFLTCLATLAVALTVSQPSPATADHVRPPPVPVTLQVPAGNKVFNEGAAIGTQDYICLPSGWAFFGPQATLFNARDEQNITHFLSPNPFENGTPRVSWQDSRDTSKIWGLAVASATVQPDAIPWLLVQVVGAEDGPTGGDELAKATFVQNCKDPRYR
jgi:hypothetical protein